MAEATKKGTQGTGSTGGRGRASGATDPNPETANLGGTGSATTSGTTGGMSAGTTGSGAGSRAAGTTGGAMGGSTMGTAGTHDMGVSASQQGGDGGTGSGLMDQVRSSASDTFQTVKSNTTAKLEEQKSTLSTGLISVADNIRALSSNLSAGQQTDPISRFAADYSQTAADKLRSAADYFNTHDIETMYRDVEGLARRNPAVFVGGAFALGFLASRFLKSSSSRANRGYGSYGSSGNAMMDRGTESTRMPRLNAGGGTSNATSM